MRPGSGAGAPASDQAPSGTVSPEDLLRPSSVSMGGDEVSCLQCGGKMSPSMVCPRCGGNQFAALSRKAEDLFRKHGLVEESGDLLLFAGRCISAPAEFRARLADQDEEVTDHLAGILEQAMNAEDGQEMEDFLISAMFPGEDEEELQADLEQDAAAYSRMTFMVNCANRLLETAAGCRLCPYVQELSLQEMLDSAGSEDDREFMVRELRESGATDSELALIRGPQLVSCYLSSCSGTLARELGELGEALLTLAGEAGAEPGTSRA